MNINEILKWFKKAVPNPTVENACVQIGCGYEETAERAKELSDDNLMCELERVGDQYKSKNSHYVDVIEALTDERKINLLDSMCDEIVTRFGEAYMLGFDIAGALDEVNRSNWSKFENGSPVFDENGKIKKGESYFKPDLTKFIGGNNEK